MEKLKVAEEFNLYQVTRKPKFEVLRTELTGNENEQLEQQWNIIKQAIIEVATDITGEEREKRELNGMMNAEDAIREKLRID
jgi:hypothetical protein